MDLGALTNGLGTPWGPTDSRSGSLSTGAGLYWGPGGNNNLEGLGVSVQNPMGNSALGQALQKMNGSYLPSATTGVGLPWGPEGQKGLSGGAAMNPMNLFPGLDTFQQNVGSGLFDSRPDAPTYQTDPSKYTAADYSDVLNSGKNQIAENLAQNNANILGQQQGQGALNSGSTGLNFSKALNNAQGQDQTLAGQVGQMGLQSQYDQMNAANQLASNNYQAQMNKYGTNQQALGQGLGMAAAIASYFI